MKNDTINKINPESAKSLDSFFKSFAEQQVNFPMKNVENLILKHSTASITSGFITKLVSKFGFNTFTVVTSVAVLVTGSIILLTSASNKLPLNNVPHNVHSNKQSQQMSNVSVPVTKSLAETVKNPKSGFSKNSNIIAGNLKSHDLVKDFSEDNNTVLIEGIKTINDIKDNRYVSSMSDLAFSDPLPHQSNIMLFPESIESKELNLPIISDDIKTVFNNFAYKNSFWLALANKATGINRSLSFLSGGKAGWTMNRNLTTGLFLYGLNQNVKANMFNKSNQPESGDLSLMYGGLMFEYVLFPERMIHYTAGISLGGGGYTVSKAGIMQPIKPFATFEPGAGIEVVLSRYFRVGLEGQYRIATELSFTDQTEKSNFNNIFSNNFSLTLLLKLGLF